MTNGKRAIPRERRITISRAYRDHAPEPVPYLRLRGKWLQEAGFDVGDPVTVFVSLGCLVIAPLCEKAPTAHHVLEHGHPLNAQAIFQTIFR